MPVNNKRNAQRKSFAIPHAFAGIAMVGLCPSIKSIQFIIITILNFDDLYHFKVICPMLNDNSSGIVYPIIFSTMAELRARVGGLQTSLSSPPSNFIVGRPKVARPFWIFGDFRCGVLLFIVIRVICKYENR